MLQPVELQDVSLRFAAEIQAVRTFLMRAGIPVGGPRATSETVVRVIEDRGFHRDLMSHIWVLLDESGPRLHLSDLLGIVTIAAAGVQGAAETDEGDAHTLLRFLMEAKHTLQGTATAEGPVPKLRGVSGSDAAGTFLTGLGGTYGPSSERRRMPLAPAAAAAEPVLASGRRPERSLSIREKRSGRFYAAVAGFAAIVLLAIFVALHRGGASTGSAGVDDENKAPIADAASHAPEGPGRSSSGRITDRTTSLLRSNSSAPSRSTGVTPVHGEGATPGAVQPSAALPGSGTIASTESSPAAARPTLADTGTNEAAAGNPGIPEGRPSAAVISRPVRAAGAPTAVAADTLSERLDSPRLPAYASDPDAFGKRYPRLLLRHPVAVDGGIAGPDTSLSAELRAPDLSSASGPSTNPSSVAAIRGLVRSTCLGMMAGNLVYGPSPAYPAAAAAARVQGEVKIQAVIDRDGTVNAARVVSGPPMLRDAALNAVQHWRYKPYMAGGNASPTGAMAVVEFELQ